MQMEVLPVRKPSADLLNADSQKMLSSQQITYSKTSVSFNVPGLTTHTKQESRRKRPVMEKKELVDLLRLRKLLSYAQKHDLPAFQSLLFYFQSFADRTEELHVEIDVHYWPSKRMREYRLGRLYAYTRSYFSAAGARKYGGLQNMKKEYRAYLCEETHWDLDLQNAHPSILLGLLQQVITKDATAFEIPILLVDSVYGRAQLLHKISTLFQLSSTSLAKKLLLRLMYGGSIAAWRDEYNIIEPSNELRHEHRSLMEKLEAFQLQLREITQNLYERPDFVVIREAFEKSLQLEYEEDNDFSLNSKWLSKVTTRLDADEQDSQKSRKNHHLSSFLSLLIGETEKQILLRSDHFLQLHDRSFQVLIHDGGLTTRLGKNETTFPIALLDELNQHIQAHFDMPQLKFTLKPFELSLKEAIHKEPLFRPNFKYQELKFYFENHRDLCYVTGDHWFRLADNYQTNIYKTASDLRTAAAGYWITSEEEEEEIEEEESNPTVLLSLPSVINNQLQQSSSKSNAVALKKRPRKPTPFIDHWLNDLSRRKFDKVYFSEKTARRDTGISHETRKSQKKNFKPKHRYLFEGWDLMDEDADPTEGSYVAFLQFLGHLIPDAKSRDYTVNWIAHLFQFPDERITGTCLCLLSPVQGSGKSTFMEIILSLLGRYGMKINNPKEQLFGNFTTAMENHVLLVIDDSGKSLAEEKEALKNLITSADARNRDLYSSERMVLSNVRFMVISNDPNVLELDQDDRRYALLDLDSALAKDHQYFIDFRRYWECVKNRRACLNYLLNEHEIPKNWHPEGSYPGSVLKTQIEASLLNPIAQYLYPLAKALQHNNPDILGDEYVDIGAQELRNRFNLWFKRTYPPQVAHRKSSGGNDQCFLTRNGFTQGLTQAGVFNTRQLPLGTDKGGHKSGQWYRMPLQAFARKADHYFLDTLPIDCCPQSQLCKFESELPKSRQQQPRKRATASQLSLQDNLSLEERAPGQQVLKVSNSDRVSCREDEVEESQCVKGRTNKKQRENKKNNSKYAVFLKSSEVNSLKSGSHGGGNSGNCSGENSNGTNHEEQLQPLVLHRNDFNQIRNILQEELAKLRVQSIAVHHHHVVTNNMISYNGSPNMNVFNDSTAVEENKKEMEKETGVLMGSRPFKKHFN